jgi:hypothetical protein
MRGRLEVAVAARSGGTRVLVVAVVGWLVFAVALMPGLQVVDADYHARLNDATVVSEAVYTGAAAVLGILLATIGRRSWRAWLSVYLGTPLLLLLGAAIAENSRPQARFNSVDSEGYGVLTAVLLTFWGYAVLTVGVILGAAVSWIWRHRRRTRASVT